MVCWVRSFLICLLALALPAQGMAAVTMLVCGPGHHGAVSTAAVTHRAPVQPVQHLPDHGQPATVVAKGQQQHPVTGHGGLQAPCSQAHTSTNGLPASDSTAPAEPLAKVHTCSLCADCCSVGAMPTALMAVPADAPAATVFTTQVLPINFVALEGLERPPRPPWA